MSILIEEDFIIRTERNKELEEDYNGFGYVVYKDKKEIKVKEVIIKEIVDVINCKTGKVKDTFVKFSYKKKYNKYLFLKIEEEVIVENGFYSKDFYSCYSPYGMFNIKEIFETPKDALQNYKKEKKIAGLCSLFM